jgi:hypothetical protein
MIQNMSVRPRARDRRRAVSAGMARLPCTISLIRRGGRASQGDPLTICPATSALTIADNYANAQFASHPDETAFGTAALVAALVAELSFAPNAAAAADAEQAAGVRKRMRPAAIIEVEALPLEGFWSQQPTRCPRRPRPHRWACCSVLNSSVGWFDPSPLACFPSRIERRDICVR